MKKQSRKSMVLELLSQGFSQGWIVKHKKIHKVLVSRYTKEFLDNGWLTCIDEKAYCKTYQSTPRAPLTSQKKSVNLLRSGPTTRVHNLCWDYEILSEMKGTIQWDKELKLKNGVKQYLLYLPSVTIAYFPKGKMGTIRIWLEEKYISQLEFLRWNETVNDDILKAQAWLQKLLLCKLSLPRISQQEHFARPIQNPELMNVLKRSGIMKMGDIWIDASKPGFQYGEIESTDRNKLEIMERMQWVDQEIPNRVLTLEEKINKIVDLQIKSQEQINTISEQITVLTRPKQTKIHEFNTDLTMYG